MGIDIRFKAQTGESDFVSFGRGRLQDFCRSLRFEPAILDVVGDDSLFQRFELAGPEVVDFTPEDTCKLLKTILMLDENRHLVEQPAAVLDPLEDLDADLDPDDEFALVCPRRFDEYGTEDYILKRRQWGLLIDSEGRGVLNVGSDGTRWRGQRFEWSPQRGCLLIDRTEVPELDAEALAGWALNAEEGSSVWEIRSLSIDVCWDVSIDQMLYLLKQATQLNVGLTAG